MIIRNTPFLLLFLLFSLSPPLQAQLISPGKLISGHQKLEGITNCTNCHELGKKGISDLKCLDCHTPIKETQNHKFGFHSQKEVLDKSCASCHKDHFGAQFDAIRFDSTQFDHKKTSFPLLGKHIDANCASCHKSEFVKDSVLLAFNKKHDIIVSNSGFLGLKTDCESCHKTDSPHLDQFIEKSCSSCHNEKDWKDVSSFDHKKTNFPLLGKHIDVTCESCHKPFPDKPEVIQYAGIEFASCVNCHEDVHEKRLGTDCQSCHSEKSFHLFTDFPEKTYNHKETGFELIGSHFQTECKSCHNSADKKDGILYSMSYKKETLDYTYPHPISANCESCHSDIHKGIFKTEKGITESCTSCHTQTVWQPSSFSIEAHQTKAKFALTGSHLATPCFTCHDKGTRKHDFPIFRFSSIECESCHKEDNPHGSELVDKVSGKTVCENCHGTENWNAESFNHDKTDFPLTGRHKIISCSDCHKSENNTDLIKRSFVIAEFECESCHKKDDPHQGQFKTSNIGTDCKLCHDNQAFTISSFDHELTRFSLKGAHEDLNCSSCHKNEHLADGTSFIRFVPLSNSCSSCHASNEN